MTDSAIPGLALGEGNRPKPRVLFVYYTHTQQSLKVFEAMADVLRERYCDVSQAGIEFTDPHYARKFSVFPFGAQRRWRARKVLDAGVAAAT